MSVFGSRLKEARLRAGLSQEQLGIEAGLDPMSASARMNRYELGRRAPDFPLAIKLAGVLRVPVGYLYSADNEQARLLVMFDVLPKAKKAKVLEVVEGLSSVAKATKV
ncbi:MAG: helix-turn-helix transcriptional regulator [Pseudomonadota bacterium]